MSGIMPPIVVEATVFLYHEEREKNHSNWVDEYAPDEGKKEKIPLPGIVFSEKDFLIKPWKHPKLPEESPRLEWPGTRLADSQ